MKSDEEILAELARAAEGLWCLSESDYPLEPFRLGAKEAPTPANLRRAAGAGEGAGVESRKPEEFFRPNAFVEDARGEFRPAPAARVLELSRVLAENLSDVKVYRVGEINIAVYVLGRSAGGGWLGVSTRVVET